MQPPTDAPTPTLSAPKRRDSADAQGRVLFILATQWTVVPFAPMANGGWMCAVVGGAGEDGACAVVRDDLIETALEVSVTDPRTDRAAWLKCWSAQLYPRWPGSTAYQFLGAYLQRLLPPTALVVQLADDETRRAVAVACRVPVDKLGSMLENLVHADLLEPLGTRSYALTLPPASRVIAPTGLASAMS